MRVGVLVLLMGVTVIFLPAVLPLLIPGVQVSPLDIAKSLVLLMLIPLAIGLFVNRCRPAMAARTSPIVSALAMAVLALGAIVLLALHGRSLLGTFGGRDRRLDRARGRNSAVWLADRRLRRNPARACGQDQHPARGCAVGVADVLANLPNPRRNSRPLDPER